MKEIKIIKKKMMQSLEELDSNGVVQGEFLCHEDVPDECPMGFDDYFCVVGDSEKHCYLVLIQKIDY